MRLQCVCVCVQARRSGSERREDLLTFTKSFSSQVFKRYSHSSPPPTPQRHQRGPKKCQRSIKKEKKKKTGSEVSSCSLLTEESDERESGRPQLPWIHRQKKKNNHKQQESRPPASPTHKKNHECQSPFIACCRPPLLPSEVAAPGLCLWLVFDPASSLCDLAAHCCSLLPPLVKKATEPRRQTH